MTSDPATGRVTATPPAGAVTLAAVLDRLPALAAETRAALDRAHAVVGAYLDRMRAETTKYAAAHQTGAVVPTGEDLAAWLAEARTLAKNLDAMRQGYDADADRWRFSAAMHE